MEPVLSIAKYIINKSLLLKKPVTNLKLQKMLYFVQVESLRDLKKPAFSETIRAWRLGPVVPEAYYEFSMYAAMPILNKYDVKLQNKEIRYVVDYVIDEYIDEPAWKLVDITHKIKSPWDIVFNVQGNKSGAISIKIIRENMNA